MTPTDAGERPFADLPAALVEEALETAGSIGQELLADLQATREQRSAWRDQIRRENVVSHESDLPAVDIPTTCGVDGSYAIERLLGIDLVAAAAVAVEGLTPPSETRHWEQPHHRLLIKHETHESETGTILRAIMIGEELELAVEAPHQVVMLDGSLTTPTIHLNQALNLVSGCPTLQVSAVVCAEAAQYLSAYSTILAAGRTDRAWVAAPKYTARRELGEAMGWPERYDDKAMLSLLLEPGEFTRPRSLGSEPWHINLNPIPDAKRRAAEESAERVVSLLGELHIVYYRPNRCLPAVRLEMGRAVAQTPGRLASVINGVKHQCGTAAMMEPYPLYMADRMVKHLSRALPTFRHVATQSVAEQYTGDIAEVYLSLHAYRTDSGG